MDGPHNVSTGAGAGIRGDDGDSTGTHASAGGGGSSRFISQIFWPEHCLNLGDIKICCYMLSSVAVY